jgi:hypothetical protein
MDPLSDSVFCGLPHLDVQNQVVKAWSVKILPSGPVGRRIKAMRLARLISNRGLGCGLDGRRVISPIAYPASRPPATPQVARRRAEVGGRRSEGGGRRSEGGGRRAEGGPNAERAWPWFLAGSRTRQNAGMPPMPAFWRMRLRWGPTRSRRSTAPISARASDDLAGLDSLGQAVDQIVRRVFVLGMRPFRVDEYHVHIHGFEPLFQLDAHHA